MVLPVGDGGDAGRHFLAAGGRPIHAEQVAHRLATVSLVSDAPLGTQARAASSGSFDGPSREQRLDALGFVALARRQDQRHQPSVAVGAQVDFGAESALAAA